MGHFEILECNGIFVLGALKEKGRVIFKIPEKTKELVDYVVGISVRVKISDL